MVADLCPDLVRSIAAFTSFSTATRLASVNKELAWDVLPDVKRKWAERLLVRICRAHVPALTARKANPAVTFLRLAQRAKCRVLAHYEDTYNVSHAANPLQYVQFDLGRGYPVDLVVSRLDGMFAINEQTEQQTFLDSTEAISTFLLHHPRALDRLTHDAMQDSGSRGREKRRNIIRLDGRRSMARSRAFCVAWVVCLRCRCVVMVDVIGDCGVSVCIDRGWSAIGL